MALVLFVDVNFCKSTVVLSFGDNPPGTEGTHDKSRSSEIYL